LQRIRENFHQAFAPVRMFPTSANGAPLHSLHWERSPRLTRAQSVSLVTHAAIIGTLLLLAVPARQIAILAPPGVKIPPQTPTPRDLWTAMMGRSPSDGRGSGGGKTPIPATTGNLVPVSSIQIVRPSLPPKRESIVPIPPTILDPAAPPALSSVNKIGLPWMSDDTNSPGPGDSHTIGNSNGRTMGDGPVDGPGGEGDSSSAYRPGVKLPTCVYCPDPQFTDEAREAKLQGRVTLRVLVGADGRASQIQVVQGIGMGLDDHAVQSVRSWKFTPAQDVTRHAVPSWITIEIIFRLI
ncbi:MAG TPA: energy transducer TonB, partial [Terriglobales bacterium]|nr:energy transducer TonB [Terriglobales bacterium]